MGQYYEGGRDKHRMGQETEAGTQPVAQEEPGDAPHG